jgi:hypothetical protein
MRPGIAIVTIVLCLLGSARPAAAASITIDTIIYEQDGAVNPSVYSAGADFSLSGNTLTIVLRNTSSGLSGGKSSTNLLSGLAFNLPTEVAIANNGAANSVAISEGSRAINFLPPIVDSTWGAANGPIRPINRITGPRGRVNAGITTLQSQMDFDLTGAWAPPANVSGPGFGLLSASVRPRAAGGHTAVQDSLTFSLLLTGTVSPDLIDQIDRGFVVASFGSPNAVSEPGTLALLGAALVVGLAGWLRRRARRAASAAGGGLSAS